MPTCYTPKLNTQSCGLKHFLFWYSHHGCCTKRGVSTCDPGQFSFQLHSYQQRSYQDPSSNAAVQCRINLKSISWSSITLTGADSRVWHWKDNHLERKTRSSAIRLLNCSGWPQQLELFNCGVRQRFVMTDWRTSPNCDVVLSAVKILLMNVEKGKVFQKLGRWLDEPYVYHIQADQSVFLLPVQPVSNSSRLPVGARGNIRCMRPSCGKSRCTAAFVEVEKSLQWNILFCF